jgi:hypothetical protein
VKIFLAVLVFLYAFEALACPNCTNPREKNRVAYLVTTALLTFGPLLSVGGIVWWAKGKLFPKGHEEE